MTSGETVELLQRPAAPVVVPLPVAAPAKPRRQVIRQYELVERVKAYDPDADEDLLNRAYVFAMKAHGSQLRASGDPYFHHPVEVAGILTDTVDSLEKDIAEARKKIDLNREEIAAFVRGATDGSWADYQLSAMGDALSLGVYCHENGHMLCDFPDLYDNATSRRGIGPTSISHHPAGIPHGPQPGAYEGSIGKTQTDELAVMLDTFKPLGLTADARTIEAAWRRAGRASRPWSSRSRC